MSMAQSTVQHHNGKQVKKHHKKVSQNKKHAVRKVGPGSEHIQNSRFQKENHKLAHQTPNEPEQVKMEYEFMPTKQVKQIFHSSESHHDGQGMSIDLDPHEIVFFDDQFIAKKHHQRAHVPVKHNQRKVDSPKKVEVVADQPLSMEYEWAPSKQLFKFDEQQENGQTFEVDPRFAYEHPASLAKQIERDVLVENAHQKRNMELRKAAVMAKREHLHELEHQEIMHEKEIRYQQMHQHSRRLHSHESGQHQNPAMTFSVSVDGQQVPVEMYHEEPQPYPQMQYQWAPAFAKRDHPINHHDQPVHHPHGDVISTIFNGANITPVQEQQDPFMLTHKAKAAETAQDVPSLTKQVADKKSPVQQQSTQGNKAADQNEKPKSAINDENDDEFELTLKRLDERSAKAKVALVKIQKVEEAKALAQKKKEEESLAQEKPDNSEAIQHEIDIQTDFEPRVEKRSADEIGDSFSANKMVDDTDKLEDHSPRLSQQKEENMKKEKSEKTAEKENKKIEKAAEAINEGKQIAGSTTEDLPPPPGDIASPSTDADKVTKHELEIKDKTKPIPGNKIDEAKSVTVISRPHAEPKKDTASKTDFAPKDKDIPITYEGSGIQPYAMAEIQMDSMNFAQVESPHKKSKKHHKKSKKSKSQWLDTTQPGPMDLPKDEEPLPADDQPEIADGMDESEKEEARMEAIEEKERKMDEEAQEAIRNQEEAEEKEMQAQEEALDRETEAAAADPTDDQGDLKLPESIKEKEPTQPNKPVEVKKETQAPEEEMKTEKDSDLSQSKTSTDTVNKVSEELPTFKPKSEIKDEKKEVKAAPEQKSEAAKEESAPESAPSLAKKVEAAPMVEPALETAKTEQAKDDDIATSQKKTSSPKSLAKKAKKEKKSAKKSGKKDKVADKASKSLINQVKAAKPILEAIIPGMADKIEEGMEPQEAAKEAMKEMQAMEQPAQDEQKEVVGPKGKEFTKADAKKHSSKAVEEQDEAPEDDDEDEQPVENDDISNDEDPFKPTEDAQDMQTLDDLNIQVSEETDEPIDDTTTAEPFEN